MGVDVVEPGGLHRLRGRVGAAVGQGGEDAFDAAQLWEGVDEAGAESVEEAVFVCLWEAREGEVSGCVQGMMLTGMHDDVW